VTVPAGFEQTLAELRRSFDQGFAAAPATEVAAVEDLLAVRVAGEHYAVRLAEIAGVAANRRIVPVPSRRSDLLGVAAIRGNLVPVYNLAVLLGHDPGPRPVAWLALCGSAEPLALGFEELESFLRVPRAHVGEVVRVGAQARRVIDIRSILEKVAVHPGVAGKAKER
jgi:hypothetical protein